MVARSANSPSSSRRDPWIDEPALPSVLQLLREHRRLTQKALAERAGVSPSAITRLEAGSRRPSHKVLEQLARGLGTSADALLDAARRLAAGDPPEEVIRQVLAAPPHPGTDMGLPSEIPGDYGREAASLPRSREVLEGEVLGHRAAEMETKAPGVIDLLGEALAWLAEHDDVRRALPRLGDELREVLRGAPGDREPVAAMTPGVVRYVFPHALARDHYGEYWINPLARARTGGLPGQDPGVERYDDGTVVVDLSDIDDEALAQRDPTVHRLRVSTKRAADPTPAGSDLDLEQAYARTVLEITWRDGTNLTVEPRPEGEVEVEPRPEGELEGDFPDGASRIHVITAFNPRSRLVSRAQNLERNRLLRHDLDRAGLTYVEAVARSRDDSWAEDSFAVIDADPETVLDLARRYEQIAIFEWTPEHLATLWTASAERSAPRGWATRQGTGLPPSRG